MSTIDSENISKPTPEAKPKVRAQTRQESQWHGKKTAQGQRPFGTTKRYKRE